MQVVTATGRLGEITEARYPWSAPATTLGGLLSVEAHQHSKCMESPQQSDRNSDRESYLRWQTIALTQLGYTINLMMTLAGGVLAFVVKEKLDRVVNASGCGWHFALVCLGASVVLAIAANVTRALDFRYTRSAARARWKDGEDHQELYTLANLFGSWTWGLFFCQAVTFALGVMFLAWAWSLFL